MLPSMARGQKCPSCGKLTFQESDQVRQCSKCGAVGWIGGEGPEDMPKPGKTCGTCGKRTLKKVGTNGDVTIMHCFTCAATYIE
jgi:ribosomal protein L37AE/L43A